MYEPDYANRVWVAQDGSRFGPTAKRVKCSPQCRSSGSSSCTFNKRSRLTQHACTFGRSSDFVTDVSGETEPGSGQPIVSCSIRA